MKRINKFDLSKFQVPPRYRGMPLVIVVLWDICYRFLFLPSPKILYKFRVFLLKAFGAKIGENVKIRSSVKIMYPWKLSIGNNSWIGDSVDLYNLEPIVIGSNTVISQYTKIITGSHDYNDVNFGYRNEGIAIGCNVWISIDGLILPGAKIGSNVYFPPRSLIKKQ
jgi:putative colanic acid biosynthesis acetyltransferase WcaF